MKPRFLYAIGAGLVGPVKVGVSQDPARRLKQLQIAFPVRLSIIGVRPAGRSDERFVLRSLRAAKLRGEWFQRCAEVEAFLDTLSPPAQSPTEPEATVLDLLLTPEHRTCPVCTKPFAPRNGKQRYCSTKCRYAVWKKKHQKRKVAA